MKDVKDEGAASQNKSEIIQLPFRCARDFSSRLVRAKGAMMRVTGEKMSDNRFFLRLLEIGLGEIEQKYEPESSPK